MSVHHYVENSHQTSQLHSLAEDGQDNASMAQHSGRWPTHIDQQLKSDLEVLVREGFELLSDLTGSSPRSFDGLYQQWYTKAVPVVETLCPSRSEEFKSLYRWPAKKRQDFENFGIRDYLLGMSLHGGYGGIDVTRGIVARRFHQQLLILKVAHNEFSTSIARARLIFVSDMALRQIETSKSLSKSGHHLAAAALLKSVLDCLTAELAKIHGNRPRASKASGQALLRQLHGSEGLEPKLLALIDEAALRAKSLPKTPVEDDEEHIDVLRAVSVSLAELIAA